jgi:threonine/homoserine efflux transporter RhtA
VSAPAQSADRTAGDRRRARVGAALIVATSVAIQLAGALAHDLFGRLGPLGTSSLRFALGAVILASRSCTASIRRSRPWSA